MDVIVIILLSLLGIAFTIGFIIAVGHGARFLWYYLKNKVDAFCEKHDINTY